MQHSLTFSGREQGGLFGVTISGVMIAVFTQVPLLFGLAPGLALLAGMCLKKGVSPRELVKMSQSGAMKTREVLIILLLVSILLPVWELSGTVGALVELFLGWLSRDWFLTCSFLFMMLLSMLLGTSVGSLSALGVPVMGVAAAWHMPLDFVAGALISGAFVGDRTSPFSSAHQLLAHTVEVQVSRLFRILLPTTVCAVSVSLLFFLWGDWTLSQTVANGSLPQPDGVTWVRLMPPVVLLLPVFFRFPVKYGFLLSAGLAMWLALDRGTPVEVMLDHVWNGGEQVGGGIRSMSLLLLFILLTGAYNGILEGMNIVKPLLKRWLDDSRTPFSLAWRTVVASGLIAAAACNQTMPVIVAGRSFLDHWQTARSREELARVMGDSTLLFPGMIPWSVLAIMFASIIHMPVLSWLPYAVFIWSLPLITLTVSAGIPANRTSGTYQKPARETRGL